MATATRTESNVHDKLIKALGKVDRPPPASRMVSSTVVGGAAWTPVFRRSGRLAALEGSSPRPVVSASTIVCAPLTYNLLLNHTSFGGSS